jgi:site-specific DNA recombinase
MPRDDTGRQRCAIYTRKSSEEGLEQEFNSLAAQREACEAFIRSQRNEGWVLAKNRYDDGGLSGGNMERPALQQLIADIRAGRIDIVVVYKVDRLTRSPILPGSSNSSMPRVCRSSR